MRLNASLYFPLFLLTLIVAPVFPTLAQPIDIGSRRELFVDRLLIDRMNRAELKLHRPLKAPRPNSPLPEKHYITVIPDGDLYRAYWRGTDPDYKGPFHTGHPGETVHYAESRDGHEWVFPNLRLHEIGGSRENNVILASQPPLLTNFTPFLDTRPGVKSSERYKALGGHPGPGDKRGRAKAGWTARFGLRAAMGVTEESTPQETDRSRKGSIPGASEEPVADDLRNYLTTRQRFACPRPTICVINGWFFEAR